MSPQPKKTKNNPSRAGSRSGRAGSPAVGEALERVSRDLVRNVPPHNLEAEQAVLGGILVDNSVFHDLLDVITDDDFYSPAHAEIYRACQDLFRRSEPMDLITVAEALTKRGKLDEMGGAAYLSSLTEGAVGASNAVYHGRIVRDRAVQRGLIGTASQIISDVFEGSRDVDELLDNAEQSVFAISQARAKTGYVDSKTLVERVFVQIEERYKSKDLITGVPTTYSRLDEITAGFQPSDLIIVAGRPAMGKTAFALNIAMRSAIEYSTPSVVFSLEMSKEQLMQRMLCTRAKVDLANLRRGFLTDADWSRLYDAAQDLTAAPIYIDDTPALTTLDVRARCRRLKADRDLQLVIVDYLQLMRASGRTDSREQEISEISRSLKALAKEVNVPVVALSQLNRKVEDRPGSKRPILSDLRESGAIEQDADVIGFVYRDEVYNKAEDNPNKGIAEIIIGKQRNGPTGVVKLAFVKEFTAFENLSFDPAPSEAE